MLCCVSWVPLDKALHLEELGDGGDLESAHAHKDDRLHETVPQDPLVGALCGVT